MCKRFHKTLTILIFQNRKNPQNPNLKIVKHGETDVNLRKIIDFFPKKSIIKNMKALAETETFRELVTIKREEKN